MLPWCITHSPSSLVDWDYQTTETDVAIFSCDRKLSRKTFLACTRCLFSESCFLQISYNCKHCCRKTFFVRITSVFLVLQGLDDQGSDFQIEDWSLGGVCEFPIQMESFPSSKHLVRTWMNHFTWEGWQSHWSTDWNWNIQLGHQS